jgi:hypothetical protein
LENYSRNSPNTLNFHFYKIIKMFPISSLSTIVITSLKNVPPPQKREPIDKKKVIQCLNVIGEQNVQFLNQANEFLLLQEKN